MGRNFYFRGAIALWSVMVLSLVFTQAVASVDRWWGVVTVANPLPDTVATAGDNFVFEIPTGTFTDADGHSLSYTARLSDGNDLPDWLNFNTSAATFSGIPANENYGIVTVEVTADDRRGNSATDVFEIAVRAIPVVDINGSDPGINYDQAVLEEDGTDTIAITDPNVFVGDQDGTTITKVLISLSDVTLYDRAEEYLIITDKGKDAARAAGLSEPYYNPVQGYIIITGEAPFEEYNKVLREVRYVNTAEDLREGSRSVVFLVNDRDDNEANAAISIITIVPVNDPPILDMDSSDGPDSPFDKDRYETTFREDGPAVAIADDKISIEDIDYADAGSVTISLINRPDSTQETLRLLIGLPDGISAFFNDTTGVMELSGRASLDDYEEAIQRIGYHNASQDPDVTQRRVSIIFDDGGGENSKSGATTLVNIIPFNDPPDARRDTVIVAEYSQDNVVTDTLPSDIDNELSELTLTVVGLPDQGTVTYADGTPVRVNDPLDSAQLADLQYDTPKDYDATTPPGKLTYTVEDDSAATATSTVTFVINEAPEVADFTVTTDEDVAYVFTLDDFAAGYADPEGDKLTYVVISSLPEDGWLLLADDTVQQYDEIRLTALDSGKLVLVPDLNENGDPYTSFLFQAKDERAATSQLHVAIVIVRPISDPPVVDTVRVSGKENETLFFTAADFVAQFSDPEGDTLIKVKVESLPTDGTLLLNGKPVKVGDEIAVDDLEQLSFVPQLGFDGIVAFQWNGHDGSAYAERSAPVIISIWEDNRLSAINDTIRLVDITVYDGTLAAQVINPLNEPFSFRTVPVINTQHGTLTLRADGSYTYRTTEDFAGEDTFTYEVCNEADPPYCAQATVVIIVTEPLRVYEGFSPDGDGTNDVWRIRNIENYPNNTVRVFNRWGNVVFEIDGYNNDDRAWSSRSTTGLVSGNVPDGTYFYLIEPGNGQRPLSGYVIVNR